MNQLQEMAQTTALRWLEIYLDDKENLEDLWGTYLEGAFEESPVTKAKFDALMPQVYKALKNAQPLPEIDYDVKSAIQEYLEHSEDTIRASEYENHKEDGPAGDWIDNWIDAVLDAYRALRQPLR